MTLLGRDRQRGKANSWPLRTRSSLIAANTDYNDPAALPFRASVHYAVSPVLADVEGHPEDEDSAGYLLQRNPDAIYAVIE